MRTNRKTENSILFLAIFLLHSLLVLWLTWPDCIPHGNIFYNVYFSYRGVYMKNTKLRKTADKTKGMRSRAIMSPSFASEQFFTLFTEGHALWHHLPAWIFEILFFHQWKKCIYIILLLVQRMQSWTGPWCGCCEERRVAVHQHSPRLP